MTYLLLPFLVALVIGVPVTFSLGLATLTFILLVAHTPIDVISQQMYQSSVSYPLMAVPFFILAGDLMERTGITERLVHFLHLLVGRMRGGLAQVMVLSGTIFAGLTGSGVADTAAMAKVLGPSMVRQGYDKDFVGSLAAGVAVLGPIIPPSVMMVVYGAVMNQSVGALFFGGIIPGVLMGLGLMIVVYAISLKRNYPKSEKPLLWLEFRNGLRDASLALIMPIIIIFGIRGGVFTPTEGGAIAAVYSLIIGVLFYRSLKIKDVIESFTTSGIVAAVILLVVSTSNPFGWLLSLSQASEHIARAVLGFTSNKYIILLLINLFLLFMGMIMEGNAIILLLAPILVPIVTSLGVDPLHFGLVMLINLSIGLITPPVGLNLFIASPLMGTTIERLSKAILPFLALELLLLLIFTYIPKVVVFLPRLMGY